MIGPFEQREGSRGSCNAKLLRGSIALKKKKSELAVYGYGTVYRLTKQTRSMLGTGNSHYRNKNSATLKMEPVAYIPKKLR
jgi:hypothetical protein